MEDLLPNSDIAAGLTARAEARRVSALEELPAERRTQLGQFFTPKRAAEFIASLPRLPEVGRLRVLDPGAGSGSLTAALAARILRDCPAVELEIVAVEVDQRTTEFLRDTVTDVSNAASEAGAKITCRLLHEDYLSIGTGLAQSAALQEPFDLVIMNPPYGKLALSSSHRQTLLKLGVECSNLYACFLTLGTICLKPGGQLVAITPRSFTNGPYFGQFRHFFLDRVALDRIHVFESRSTVFADTGVLQENIIFSATRAGANDKVMLSVSQGHNDRSQERLVSYRDVVRPLDKQRFIRILANDDDIAVAEIMTSLPSTLVDLAMQVSTGRVVDFRSRECLLEEPTADSYPLIYPGNVCGGIIDWPRSIRKHQGFAVRAASDEKFLLPEGYYVVVKRFSSKEECRRLVAAVWDPTIHCGPVAFENHLNFFHVDGAGLERDLAVGLSYWLNSSLVDDFFRTFSGHTQVNATDLRSLRFPSRLETHFSRTEPGHRTSRPGDHRLLRCNINPRVRQRRRVNDPMSNRINEVPRINEVQSLLTKLGFDRSRTNERSALVFAALLGLTLETPWAAAVNPMMGTRAIMDWIRDHYEKEYAPNSRETIRRSTLHQFVESGLLEENPDRPDRPTNSPHWCYQVRPLALEVVRQHGHPNFDTVVVKYLDKMPGLKSKYEFARKLSRIPVTLPGGRVVNLSPGGQNILIKNIVEEFCAYFTPGGEVLYIGDADAKWAVFEERELSHLGVVVDQHGKMPDLVVFRRDLNWLVLLEAVTSHGPVDAQRHGELSRIFGSSTAGLVYVSCFPDRREMRKYLAEISWETEVWCADNPTHLIHFNGERFLGPYGGTE